MTSITCPDVTCQSFTFQDDFCGPFNRQCHLPGRWLVSTLTVVKAALLVFQSSLQLRVSFDTGLANEMYVEVYDFWKPQRKVEIQRD